MRRTQAAAHASNLYTEGNPSLGIPATVVGAIEMNNIQEEICNVIEAAGITLDGTGVDDEQLLEAINILIPQGGSAPVEVSIANNQVAPLAIAGLAFPQATVKAARIVFDAHREDAGQKLDETGELWITHNATSGWRITKQSFHDDVGITFTINSSGQILYTSTNFTGGSYAGTLRASFTKLAQ